jgi:hypothetical protein
MRTPKQRKDSIFDWFWVLHICLTCVRRCLQDPKWLSMTNRYIVKFIEDARQAPETGTAIPHPAMLIDEQTDDQLTADSMLAEEFDELDEMTRELLQNSLSAAAPTSKDDT